MEKAFKPKEAHNDPLAVDFFALLDEPYDFVVRFTLLQKKYQQLVSAVHPDRFIQAPKNQKQHALLLTARINEAWRTLSQPLERACYLLSLQGIFVKEANGSLPQDWLTEQITWRELIGEAAGNISRLEHLFQECDLRIRSFLEKLAPLRQEDGLKATPIVQQWCFFAKLAKEIDGAIAKLPKNNTHIAT